LVDLAGPGFDSAFEVDGIIKAGVSEKVDDHLTASTVMAKDHQWLIGWQVIDARWDLRHWDVQGTFQLANIELSRLSHIEHHMLLSRAAHIRKLANRDCIRSSERFCGQSVVAP
jgi:hypothetical protein